MVFIKRIGIQTVLLLAMGSCAIQQSSHFKKVVRYQSEISSLSLGIQKRLADSVGRYIELDPSDKIFTDYEKKTMEELDIFSVHMWRTRESHKDSVIVFWDNYTPIVERPTTITFCFANFALPNSYKRVSDQLYYRKN